MASCPSGTSTTGLAVTRSSADSVASGLSSAAGSVVSGVGVGSVLSRCCTIVTPQPANRPMHRSSVSTIAVNFFISFTSSIYHIRVNSGVHTPPLTVSPGACQGHNSPSIIVKSITKLF